MPRFIVVLATLSASVCWGVLQPVAAQPPGYHAPVEHEKPAAEAASPPARKPFKLPGLIIDFRQRCVDIESTVCLDEGLLELIACTKDTKEHESIVAVKARPMHIHTALLLLGADPGNPAIRKPVDEQQKRWVDLPPRGNPVEVFLVFKDAAGRMVEHPIGDFIARADRQDDDFGADDKVAAKDAEFPNTFLFAGSLLHEDGPGPRKYLADLSGNVISIVTFGDELLCLPHVYGHSNDSLMWQVNPTKLPKVGSNVTLRLRPRINPAKKDDETQKPARKDAPAADE
jgi:hypothetical protein